MFCNPSQDRVMATPQPSFLLSFPWKRESRSKYGLDSRLRGNDTTRSCEQLQCSLSKLLYPKRFLFFALFKARSILSLPLMILVFLSPHFKHLCIRWKSCFFESISIGSIRPKQSAFLSPGFMSVCLLHRQTGQWFVYPFPLISCPHFSHLKFSTLFTKPIKSNSNKENSKHWSSAY